MIERESKKQSLLLLVHELQQRLNWVESLISIAPDKADAEFCRGYDAALREEIRFLNQALELAEKV